MRQIYAIGFKDWVELRACESEPVAENSSFSKIIKEQVLVGYETDMKTGNLIHKYMDKDVPIKLRSVVYNGGKVVYTINSNKLTALLGFRVGKHKCLIIGKEYVRILVENGFTKLNRYVN